MRRIKFKFKKINFKRLKNKKLIIFIFIILVISTCGIVFSRYIYDGIQNLYFSTKKFYFNSDKLTQETATYQLENWSGVDSYTINVNMNSIKNSLVRSPDNIGYTISVSCPETVTCQIGDGDLTRTIPAGTNIDSFDVLVSPNITSRFEDGDRVIVAINASSTTPYEKTISARFILKVGKIGVSYEITDTVGSPYLEVRITNTVDYYLVDENFLSYQTGERIDIDTYNNLSSVNKAKCTSELIELQFDPNVVLLDMTSSAYLRNEEETTTIINNYDYVNSFSFKINAISSEIIKFYKITPAINYTYPIVNQTPVVIMSN